MTILSLITSRETFRKDNVVADLHSAGMTIFPRELLLVQAPDILDGTPLDKCHIEWFLHLADKPRNNPDGPSIEYKHKS